MKKKFVQRCKMASGPGRGTKPASGRKVRKKAISDVYNRFYKEQVSALYCAVRDAG